MALLGGLALAGSTQAQTVTGISNNLVSAGDPITLTGTSLGGISQVLLDGQPLAIKTKTATQLTITLPIGASSGYLRLMTASNGMVLVPTRIRVKRASSAGGTASNSTVTMPSVSQYSTPAGGRPGPGWPD